MIGGSGDMIGSYRAKIGGTWAKIWCSRANSLGFGSKIWGSEAKICCSRGTIGGLGAESGIQVQDWGLWGQDRGLKGPILEALGLKSGTGALGSRLGLLGHD